MTFYNLSEDNNQGGFTSASQSTNHEISVVADINAADGFTLVTRRSRTPAAQCTVKYIEQPSEDQDTIEILEKFYNRMEYDKSKHFHSTDAQKHYKRQKLLAKKLLKRAHEKTYKPHVTANWRPDYEVPEAGTLKWFTDMMGICGSYIRALAHEPHVEAYLHIFESTLLFNLQLPRCRDVVDVVLAYTSFVKSCGRCSILTMLTDVCGYLTTGMYDPTDYFMPNTLSETEIFPQANVARSLQDAWKLLRSNPVFEKVGFLITAAMASSFCAIKEINLDFAGISLIHLEALKVQANALDIVDAAVDTFVWIAETGWRCIEQKSLLPILYSDQRLEEFTELCNELIGFEDAVKSGNLPDEADYKRKLDNALITLAQMQKASPSPAIKEILQKKYVKLITIKQDLFYKDKNTQYRAAPIGWSIYGESSIGKSDLAELVMKTSLVAQGFSDAKTGIITLNESDKYDSTYTSDVQGVFIDDANNANPEYVEKSPTQRYIQFFNNVCTQAVKAEINEKGCVFVNFKVGVITTNSKLLGANIYSNYPVAVLRRFIHMTVKVRDEYCVPGGRSLNTEYHKMKNCPNDQFPDAWEITFEEVIPDGTPMGTFQILQCPIDGVLTTCRDLSVMQATDVIIYMSQQHLARQTRQVKRNRILEAARCCPQCFRIPGHCRCAAKAAAAAEPAVVVPVVMTDNLVDHTPVISDESSIPSLVVDHTSDCITTTTPGTAEAGDEINSQFFQSQPPGTEDIIPQPPDSDDLDSQFLRDIIDELDEPTTREDDVIDDHNSQYLQDNVDGQVLFEMISWYNALTRIVPFSRILIASYMEKHFTSWATYYTQTIVSEYVFGDYFADVVMLTPTWIAQSRWFTAMAIRYRAGRPAFRAVQNRFQYGCILVLLLFISYFTGINDILFIAILIVFIGLLYCDAHIRREQHFVEALVNENAGATLRQYREYINNNRTTIARVGAISVATLGAIVLAIRSFNYVRKNPHSLDDFTSVDAKMGWFGFMMDTTRSNCKSSVKGATERHAIDSLKKNLYWCRATLPNGLVLKCNAFFPRKSVVFLPHHMFFEGGRMDEQPYDLIDCEFQQNASAGSKFTCKISLSMSYVCKNMDMVACYVPNCRDMGCMEKWMVLEKPRGRSMAYFTCTDSEQKFSEENINIEFGMTGHKYRTMYGGTYKSNLANLGACMGIIVSDCANPALVGFHIGGGVNKLGEKIGICQTLTQSEYTHIIAELEKIENLSSHATDVPETQYGVPLLSSTEVHTQAKYVLSMDANNAVDVLGSTRLRSKQVSTVGDSILSPIVEEICGVPNKWGPPKLIPNFEAFNINLDLISKPGDTFNPVLLKRAQRDWESGVTRRLLEYVEWDKQTADTFRPLEMQENLLGIPGIRFIDAMPMNTGAGFPLFGKKSKKDVTGIGEYFVDTVVDNKVVRREPTEKVLAEVDRLMKAYSENKRGYPVTTATLKDEPTPLGKEKVRVFQAAPVALGLLIRKYFLPISRFLCCNPLQTELAVGANCFGTEWEELMAHAFEYADDDMGIAWDYSKYDVRMSSQITRAVWNTLIFLAELGGYPEDAINIMKAMVIDICHPLVDMNGTMIMAYNMNTSGNNMTVFINSIAGSFYVRMGLFNEYPNAPAFRECVKLLTYGDDAIGSVKQQYRNFNFVSFKKFLLAHKMGLTLPSKDARSVEFLHRTEIDFLKRKSYFIPEIGYAVGQIEEDSIFKSLHSNVKSGSATPREVACSCVEGALHEWFAFGATHYELRRQQMKLICEQLNLPVAVLDISFEQRVAMWKEKYGGITHIKDVDLKQSLMDTRLSETEASVQIEMHVHALGDFQKSSTPYTPFNKMNTPLVGRSNPSAHKREPGSVGRTPIVGGDTIVSHESTNHTKDSCILCDILLSMRQEQLDINAYQTRYLQSYLDARDAAAKESKNKQPSSPTTVLDRKCLDAIDLGMTMEEYLEEGYNLNSRPIVYDSNTDLNDAYDRIVPHALSGDHPVSSGETISPIQETANVRFVDDHAGYMDSRDGEIDVLRTSLEDTNVSLSEFFARPIKLGSWVWPLNAQLFLTLDPWTMFFENPRVINRLTNYKNLKAVLHVKFIVNGTSMHYGRMLVSYLPLHNYDKYTQRRTSNALDYVEASQRPCIWLDPSTSQGGTLRLPFFNPENMLDIPSAGWRNMGEITMTSIVALKHANNATNGITVSAFAWAEDVVVSGLTNVDCTFIVPQAASEYKGIVSKPASNIAKLASSLSEIPRIGRFATATSIGAQSIAYMANLFGYSKVRDTAPGFHHIQPMDSIAVCDGHDNVMTLAVDSKNELTIDPIVAGLESVDELTIRNIAGRETWFTAFAWPELALPEQKLFDIVVDPCVARLSNATRQTEIHMTACALASIPFDFWRGTMKYRFQFCTSAFHKGRVKFVYDPYASGTSTEYNTVYTQIVDISEEKDVTIEVGWGSHMSWRKRLIPTQQDTWSAHNGSIPAPGVRYTANNAYKMGNGVLSVYVVSPLAVAASASQITVLVSVSAGDDFEVASPVDSQIRTLGYEMWPSLSELGLVPLTLPLDVAPLPLLADVEIKPQAAVEATPSIGGVTVEGKSRYLLGNRPVMSPELNKIYMGESVMSFRSLLKRYNFHDTHWIKVAGQHHATFNRSLFPTFPQVGAYGTMSTTVGTTLAYWARTTLMHLIGAAFGGWRGGIRYMLYTHADGLVLAYRQPGYTADSNEVTAVTAANIESQILVNYPSGNSGSAVWHTGVNPYQKLEVPYQLPYRFTPMRFGNSSDTIPKFQDTWNIDFVGVTTNISHVAKWVAAGEDFTLLFFLGSPILYLKPYGNGTL